MQDLSFTSTHGRAITYVTNFSFVVPGGTYYLFAYRTELATMKAIEVELRIFDTLTRGLVPVRNSSQGGNGIRIYCCGPTVYRDAHVGNLRTFLLTDIVTRTLRFLNHDVTVVQNITDVGHLSEDFAEDKMIAQSRIEKRDPFAIAREYEAHFHHDLAALNITPADRYPRASETIELMIAMIEKLMAKGLAYIGEDGTVYFSASSFPSYGELSGNRLDALKPGHRYEFVEGGAKRFHADWALWKSAGTRTEMIWDSPWGKGFPGWHIECSAMSLHFLAGHIDLHIGGIDLRFPHHEDERAQSNSITADEAVSSWLHGEHLLFEGRKMSKSAGNVVLISDVIARGFDPLAVRFCFMENRYRSQMDLSWQSITAADATLRRWRERYATWRGPVDADSDLVQRRIAAVIADFTNDLDTPRAMIKLREIEKDQSLSDGEKRLLFEKLDPLFGLDLTRAIESKELPEGAQKLLNARAQARANKDFGESDRLRDQLTALGIEVRDTATGQEWRSI